jgi:hypothetical protein
VNLDVIDGHDMVDLSVDAFEKDQDIVGSADGRVRHTDWAVIGRNDEMHVSTPESNAVMSD